MWASTMRNLLGRLHSRPPEELARIAQAWRIPLDANDRRATVGPLYRALTDPRTVRDAWDLLDAGEQAIVRLLAVSEDTALTLAELTHSLDLEEPTAREAATRLYHKGMLAREGDDDPLPIGVAPRLFLPRELGLLFRRVQDEIDAGDLSTTPLRALLSLLDDTEIEEAGKIWGLKVIPGLRGREELSRRLLEQVGDAERVATVAQRRQRDAARIWERLRAEPEGQPVPLAAAAAGAGLAGESPREANRLRDALAELERALLVWHTYRPDGSRWLFVPADIRTPQPRHREELPPLTPVAAETVVPPPWRHPAALAWDLLTVLRQLTRPHAPRLHRDAEISRPWRRRLNHQLWSHGTDLPPAGYVEFLLELAVAEGLLNEENRGPLLLTPAIRAWRDRSFPEQMTRLRERWLGSASWIEGAGREEVQVWGADWRGFRRKLTGYLGALDAGAWHPIDVVAAWLAALDTELLGSTFTVATARHVGENDDDESRRAAIAEVAAGTLTTALDWFGLVEVAAIPHHTRAVRLTPAGQALVNDESPPETTERRRFIANADLTIALVNPTPLQVWSVSAFAELEQLGQESVYRLTPDAVGAALDAGFDVRQIATFLTNQRGQPLPAAIETALADWTRTYRRVRVRHTVALTPDDTATIDALAIALEAARYTVRRLPDELIVDLPPTTPDAGPDHALADLNDALRAKGFTPHWTPSPHPDRRRP
ncbi:MAG: helicase-associated domain-containing protein [Thermomicrobiales bacterium]